MGMRHKTLGIEGVQFHPESILTIAGKDLLAEFPQALTSRCLEQELIANGLSHKPQKDEDGY